MAKQVRKCKWCQSYESYRMQIRDETKTTTQFWCALRIRVYRWKEKTTGKPLFVSTIRESRLHYCPECGKRLIEVRHRRSKNGIINT